MSEKKKPLTPVKPINMELVFLYPCPFCAREVPLIAPTKPTMAHCDSCRQRFPVVPADDRTVRFFKLMTASGRAGIDPDFL